jgi:hypothetical protein
LKEVASGRLNDRHELPAEFLGETFEGTLFALQDLRVIVG